MARFPTVDISILLEATAFKAGVSDFDNGGFIKLAKFLTNCPNDFQVTLSERYLKEQLYDKIQKAKKSGQALIGLSLAHVDTLSLALGFKAFKGFQRYLEKLKGWLQEKKRNLSDSPKLIVGDSLTIDEFVKINNVLEAFEPPIRLVEFSSSEYFENELQEETLIFIESGISKLNSNLSSFEVIEFDIQQKDNNTSLNFSGKKPLDYNGVLITISTLKGADFKNQITDNGVEVEDDQIGTSDSLIKKATDFGIKYSFQAGLIITLLLFILTFVLSCPTDNQQLFFRVVLSLGVGGIASRLPQFLNIKLLGKDKTNIGFTGFLVFLLVYFVNPHSIVQNDNCDTARILRGKVMYLGKPLSQAHIVIPGLDKQDITSYNGSFDLSFNKTPNFPITISLTYKNIDSVFELSNWPENNELMIYLKDTISELTRPLIHRLVESRLESFKREIDAKHKTELANSTRGDTSFKSLIASYASFDELDFSGYRNEVFFSNGFKTLNTQKSIRAAGIEIYPMNPYQSYGLSQFYAELYEDDIRKTDFQTFKRMRFALINRKQIQFGISTIERVSNDSYQVSIDFTNNIVLVKTEVECSMSSGSKKFQKTHYWGMKPKEKFLLRFQKGEWHLVDAISN